MRPTVVRSPWIAPLLLVAAALPACGGSSEGRGGNAAGSAPLVVDATRAVSAEETLRAVPELAAMLDEATASAELDGSLRVRSTAVVRDAARSGDPWSYPRETVEVDVDPTTGSVTVSSERGRFTARHLGLRTPHVAREGATIATRDASGSLRAVLLARKGAVEELLASDGDEATTGYELDLPPGWTMRVADGDASVVEIHDDRGRARFRMVADAAWDEAGTRWPVRARLNGRQVTFGVSSAAIGRVLIDPAWTGTATPARVRARASTTVLSSGKVLMLGGRTDSDGNVLCTSELYDPLDETWQAGPSLSASEDEPCTRIMDHTATPLSDGSVLIVGGANADTVLGVGEQPAALAHAWRYDPRRNTFTRTGDLAEARVHHTATLLADGRVLIAGGSDRQSPLNEGIVDCPSNAQGESCEHCVGKASAEIYDPTTGTFSTLPMPQARACHTATLLSDDSVLLIGGAGEATKILGKTWGRALDDMTVFRVGPTGGSFTKLGMSLNTARLGHAAVLDHDPANPDQDRILVAFGRDERAILPGLSMQPNPQLAELVDVKAALAGTSPTATPVDVAVCCDPSNASCVDPVPCVTRRSYVAATPLTRTRQALLVAGQEHDPVGQLNRDATPSNKVDVFDFATQKFTETTLDHAPVLKPALTTLANGKTLLVGQTAPPALFDDEAWAFAPPTTPMTRPRAWQTVTQLSSGKLLITGGQSFVGGIDTKGAEIYDPLASPPTTVDLPNHLGNCRHGHTATLLPATSCEEDAECCSSSCVANRCAGVELDASCTLGHGERVLLTGGGGLGGGAMNGGLSDCNVPGLSQFDQPNHIAQATAEIFDVATQTFRPAKGTMHTPRVYHTATRLSSGEVLVVGGLARGDTDDDDPALASAELFDPVTETFSELPAPITPRFVHSATPLPSGDVLITGGFAIFTVGNATGARATAEVFDRSTMSFRPVSDLVIARGYHTATALPNGSVLITGGSSLSLSAEIFSPETESFRLTVGEMHRTRIDARALMVPSGKVLITGGVGFDSLEPGPPFSDAELFDVSTEQFDYVPCDGCTGRVDHAMVLLPSGAVGLFGGTTTTGIQLDTTAAVDTVRLTSAATIAAPQLDAVASDVVAPGVPQALSGTRLTSFWEGSSGPYVSPTNLPTAVWIPFNGSPVVGSMVQWSETSASWIPSSSAFAGPGLLFATRSGTLSTNGLPVSVEPGPIGVPCTADTACASGFCSDGVCCNERCHDPSDPDALCRACSVALGAPADGVCALAETGTDPHQDCAALAQCAADSAACGADGRCRPCTCNSESDCAEGYTCTAAGVCAKPAVPSTPEGCSFAVTKTPSTTILAEMLVALTVIGASVRRSRRRAQVGVDKLGPTTSSDRQPLRPEQPVAR